jgi:hypothetical protein
LVRWRDAHPFAELLYVVDDRKNLRNVGAERDWSDVMSAGVTEFDLDEVEALREQELYEWNERFF